MFFRSCMKPVYCDGPCLVYVCRCDHKLILFQSHMFHTHHSHYKQFRWYYSVNCPFEVNVVTNMYVRSTIKLIYIVIHTPVPQGDQLGAVDIKACPHSCHQLACVLDKDVWFMSADSGEKIRLTYSYTPHTDLLSAAGQVIFVWEFFTNHQEHQ